MMKQIGVYAGTFDPIHKGHVAFALAALQHGLDKVYFLVEPRPHRKQGVRALEHRIAMAELATKRYPRLGVIQLEQARFYPKETLPVLQARFNNAELVLLFGDDVIRHMVDHLSDWPHIQKLAVATSLLIASRHHAQTELTERLNSLKQHGIHFRYDFVELDGQYLSSSQIRSRIKSGDTPSDVPIDVENYIANNNLYTSSGSNK